MGTSCALTPASMAALLGYHLCDDNAANMAVYTGELQHDVHIECDHPVCTEFSSLCILCLRSGFAFCQKTLLCLNLLASYLTWSVLHTHVWWACLLPCVSLHHHRHHTAQSLVQYAS